MTEIPLKRTNLDYFLLKHLRNNKKLLQKINDRTLQIQDIKNIFKKEQSNEEQINNK